MADIYTIEELRERRFRSGPSARLHLPDREMYARALAKQKVDDDRRWMPCADDEWRQAMRELDEVIGPPGGDAA